MALSFRTQTVQVPREVEVVVVSCDWCGAEKVFHRVDFIFAPPEAWIGIKVTDSDTVESLDTKLFCSEECVKRSYGDQQTVDVLVEALQAIAGGREKLDSYLKDRHDVLPGYVLESSAARLAAQLVLVETGLDGQKDGKR